MLRTETASIAALAILGIKK
ncbi:MAG: hypothetical protein DRP42_05615 [Tenericutes bacterium]|nr:MAG: hypothetical protein DRP42_05615 [Mycoplasmatota bacterium]